MLKVSNFQPSSTLKEENQFAGKTIALAYWDKDIQNHFSGFKQAKIYLFDIVNHWVAHRACF